MRRRRRLRQQRCGESKACDGGEADWREAVHVAVRRATGREVIRCNETLRLVYRELPGESLNYIFMTPSSTRRRKVCSRLAMNRLLGFERERLAVN